ncbi:unnamed protein product [Rhizophagus irregularis]|nr:unnamed protein product [Rhizophagus irregularis]
MPIYNKKSNMSVLFWNNYSGKLIKIVNIRVCLTVNIDDANNDRFWNTLITLMIASRKSDQRTLLNLTIKEFNAIHM